MEYLIGIMLALGVGMFASAVGFDRSRVFYPVLLMVIASYYLLFAVMGRSVSATVLEAWVLCGFVALSVAGFKWNLWLVVAALLGHGALDAAHPHLVANPGAPTWWPMFCMAFDLAAAGCLAIRLTPASRPAVATELLAADACERLGRAGEAFCHLERAHVLSQSSTIEHVRVHVHMLRWSLRQRDLREAHGQILRIVGAAGKTAFGFVPLGNTGGSNVSPFRAMPIPPDLAALVAKTPRRGLRESVAAALRAGASQRADLRGGQA